MRTFFTTPDGTAKVEKKKVYRPQLEMRDAYHVVNPDGIWHDDQHRKGAIMIIWNGSINPEGSELPLEAIYRIRNECETLKKARKPHESVLADHELFFGMGPGKIGSRC